MKSAIVIGAGFGGLALAIRLAAAGTRTLLVEGREQPGGHAGQWQRDGFTFDASPMLVSDPQGLRELWSLTGHDMRGDIALEPVLPFTRISWPDGSRFDLSHDMPQMLAEVERISPRDVAGYRRFLDYAGQMHEEAFRALAHRPMLTLADMARATAALARLQPWRSHHGMLSSFVRHEKLREALSCQLMLTGGNPMTASAVQASLYGQEQAHGVWFPKGGTHALAAAMARHFERIGGTLILGDAAARIETRGNRATGIVTHSGRQIEADMVASNADAMHSYRDLLSGHRRGARAATALAAKRFSPSLFLVHFGIDGRWPGIPHRMMLLGPRHRGWLNDMDRHGVLPRDFSLCLSHPSLTDPSLAPEGCSTFCAMVPVPHMGKLPVDWATVAPILEQRILDEIGRRLIPDIHERIITRFSYAPPDFAHDLNAHLGCAFALEPTPLQSGWGRVHTRDAVIPNLYFTGAATHPGAGMPAVLASARAAADLMLNHGADQP